MRASGAHYKRKIVEYDAFRRRLWILGQRCHHGATGSVVATIACLGLMIESVGASTKPRKLFALAATGGVMMAHDWKDHSIWFERGHGTQP